MCFVLGFSIIFGSTLSVSASEFVYYTDSFYDGTLIQDGIFTSNVVVSSDYIKYSTGVNGSITMPPTSADTSVYYIKGHTESNGSGSTYVPNQYIGTPGFQERVSFTVNNGTDFQSVDFDGLTYLVNLHNVSLSPTKYYELVVMGDDATINGSSSAYYNYYVTNPFDNRLIGRRAGYHWLVRGSDILVNDANGGGIACVLAGNLHFHADRLVLTTNQYNFVWNLKFAIYEVPESVYSKYGGQSSYDSGTQSSINNQTEKVEQGNDIAQENADTNKDTNNKITDFFSGFFDNLVHIFVPEDGFFSSWFNELNDFFAAKLGFLYAPFDFIISFFNGVLNTVGTQQHGFTIPALSWEGTEFCPEVYFSFDMFAEEFPQLQEAVYFFSDVVIILALMRGIRAKLDLVMGVHEE